MANQRTIARSRARGEQPVTRIKEAADRIGYPAAGTPADDLDRTDEEIDVLRHIADAAELIFEHDGPVRKDPVNVLTEALRTAGEDFALFGDETYAGGGTATTMMFRRAELRCQLALALFEYRREFGFTGSADEVETDSAGGES